MGVPPYTLFWDRTLDELCAQAPGHAGGIAHRSGALANKSAARSATRSLRSSRLSGLSRMHRFSILFAFSYFRAFVISPGGPTMTPSTAFLDCRIGNSSLGDLVDDENARVGRHAGLDRQVRGADIDNPRGYYEYEAVKALKQDASWVAQSCGKAVKMVYLLVYDLPPDVEYRILFMHRKIDEVLASQKVMLDRLGKPSTIADAKMAALFRNHLVQVRGVGERTAEYPGAGREL